MPDGSSSAAPVINPGPRSAKKSSTGPCDWRCSGGWLAGAGISGSTTSVSQEYDKDFLRYFPDLRQHVSAVSFCCQQRFWISITVQRITLNDCRLKAGRLGLRLKQA